MEDEIVKFETATLAYQKGFSEYVNNYYTEDKIIENFNDGEKWSNYDFQSSDWFKENYPNVISAPTQSLLQRWLREKYKIGISIDHFTDINEYEYQLISELIVEPDDIEEHFTSYEAALEQALIEGLKLITIKE